MFSGTAVYLQLLEQRLLKAVFHLILLALLMGIIAATIHSCQATPVIENTCDQLFSQIGGLDYSQEKGIRTKLNPESAQSYILTDEFRFDYCPGKTLSQEMIRKWDTPFGLLCMDRGFLFWCENYAGKGKDHFLLVPMPLDLNQQATEVIRTDISRDEIYTYAAEKFTMKPGEKLHLVKLLGDKEGIVSQLTGTFWFIVLMATIFFALLIAAGTVLICGILQYLWTKGINEHKLSFSQILVSLIYLTFVPLIIATLYSCTMIGGITPQIVFYIFFFLLDMIVSRKIQKHLNPPQDSLPGNED